jgi:hypothetical protein
VAGREKEAVRQTREEAGRERRLVGEKEVGREKAGREKDWETNKRGGWERRTGKCWEGGGE